ncbi:AraC family transcriptional regulator [Mucilaginibacter flavidus]|uniref:AraC family transcriptional regulator n=1 Tax=Mucilaginibacter flavidus TaxID=2949309 RepID=UPI002092AFDA|nr:AraC family transcriptional regulator [Mucilaginibacter flavidus]MCO5948243.1 AraC family transcriptional regulator [Mucilaginibacter flavidus]
MKPQLIDINLSGKKTIQIKKLEMNNLTSPFHFHNLCELVWIEKSYGKRIVGDSIDNFEDGDLVLMGPNLPHIWLNDKIFEQALKGNSVKATVIYFPPDFLLNLTDEQDILNPTADLILRSARGLRFYGETSKKVIKTLSNISEKDGFKKIIYFLQAIEILSISDEYNYLASLSFKNSYDEKDTTRINKVYQFLMQNFQRDISLKEVADLCNMTTNSFCRFFKSRTQKSLTRFINELRIGQACKLLQNEENGIADVCFQCGYNNLTNFNKFFRTITGKKPSEYKKQLKD